MSDLPAWQPFDPSTGSLPDSITSLIAEGGDPQVVALLVMPGIDERWGAEAAVSIAGAWDDSADNVLLADLNLRDPVIHEVLGQENNEGISDVLLYGVSVQHAARASERGTFLVTTAGTPVVDPEAVLAHPRWEAVTRALRDRGVTLLVHLPSDLPGTANLLEHVDRVIVLAADDGGAGDVDDVIAVLGPPVEAAVELAEAPAEAAEATEVFDVAEEMADAVIEASSDLEEEPAEEAFEAAEVDVAEEDEPAEEAFEAADVDVAEEEEPADQMDSAKEVGADDAGFGEEEAEAEDEGEFGELSVEEPAAVEEPESDDYSFDGLAGSQYGQTDDAAEDEGGLVFDSDDLGAAADAEEPEGEAPTELEAPPEAEAPMEVEAPMPAEDSTEPEPSMGVDDSLDLEGSPDMEAPLDVEPPMGMEAPMEMEPPSEAAPMEGLEPMDTFEPMPVEDVVEGGDTDDEEPSFDIGGGLELEAPEVVEEPMEVAPDASDDDEAPLESDLGGDVMEVERSSLADDASAPTDQAVMSGVTHGADVGEDAADEVLAEEGDAPLDQVPAVAMPDSGDVDEVDASAEPVGEGALEQEAAVEAGEGEEWAADAEGEELESRPERKLSGLDELERRRKWQERRRMLLTSVATAVILGGGGFSLAYYGVVDIPRITPPERMGGSVPAITQLPGPQPTTQIMSYSLLINTYRNPPRELVGVLKERLPQLLFFYSPWEVDDRVQYALFAGPAYGAVEANGLKEPLIEAAALGQASPDDWLVRETSYAFFFGEYEDAGGAEARVRELASLESPIPTYTLAVDYADGRTGVRVYGGAFTDEFNAEPLATAISVNGMEEIPLIERRGRLPE